MNTAQAILGVALIMLVYADVAQTTLTVNGGGRLSGTLSRLLWRLLLAIHRRRSSHRLLAAAGPGVVLIYIVFWFGLLWVGWGLVYAAGEPSVLNSQTRQPAELVELLYFVGYTVVTLGIGDFVPQGALWRILTPIASASGFVLLTLIITYVLAVVSAAVEARAFAKQVHGLGEDAQALIGAAWDGRDLRGLDLPLSGMAQALSAISEHYLAYPVLHYYHAPTAGKAPVLAVAVLDEALTLLCHGVRPEARPSAAVIRSARSAVDNFLAAMPARADTPGVEAPAAPALDGLRRLGIPTASEAEFQAALSGLNARRRLLQALSRNEGWA